MCARDLRPNMLTQRNECDYNAACTGIMIYEAQSCITEHCSAHGTGMIYNMKYVNNFTTAFCSCNSLPKVLHCHLFAARAPVCTERASMCFTCGWCMPSVKSTAKTRFTSLLFSNLCLHACACLHTSASQRTFRHPTARDKKAYCICLDSFETIQRIAH